MSEPLDLEMVKAREERATAELARMLNAPGGPGASWRWSIPARPDRDTDLILADSLADVPRLRAELARRDEQIAAVRALGSGLVNNGSGNTLKDRTERECGVSILSILRIS